jgi:hypothetical protein
MTAPVGEVTTPMTRGKYGSGFLRASSNNPSAASFLRRSSTSAIKAPTPAGSKPSMTIWYFDEPGKVVMRPVAITSSPSSGGNLSLANVLFQITASRRAFWSLSEK